MTNRKLIAFSISYWKNYTANQFLENISKVDILEINTTINKPFSFETNINHKFIKSTIKFKNNEADINYKSVFNFYNTLKDEEKYLTFESFLWYILSITIQPIKLNLWNDNIEYINFISTNLKVLNKHFTNSENYIGNFKIKKGF